MNVLKYISKNNQNHTLLTWNGILQLITLKFKTKRQPNILTTNDRDITNRRDMSNDFDGFSIDIGPSLCIPSSRKKNYKFS